MRPGSALATRIGQANADEVARIAGGTRLHVPMTVADADRLKKRFGPLLATLLVLHFGGGRIYIPRPDHSANVDRRKVVSLTRKGWSAARIARHLGCSDRTVHAKRTQSLKNRAISPATPEGTARD